MSKKNFDVYFDFGFSKIRVGAFSKKNKDKNYFFENSYLSDFQVNKLNILNVGETVEKIILEAEKKTEEYIDNINLMIDTSKALPIGLSLNKNIESKKLKKEEIYYLIQDAKQQIIRSYPDYSIIHIIVTNYYLDNIEYNFLPINFECNKLSIDIVFICFPKNFISSLEELFQKHNILIDQIIFSSYAKSLNYKQQLESFENIVFIDIGYEKTSIIYFNKGNFNFFNMMLIGGHHITKDISKILNIDLATAEIVKFNFDKDNNFLNENNLSLDLIKKVIFARIEEILEMSVKFFNLSMNSKELSKFKFVFMGEGSKILDNKFKESIAFSKDIDLLDETCANICESGLKLAQGINKQEVVIIPKKLEKKGFFERLFHFFK